MDKTVFYPDLGVAVAEMRGFAFRCVVGHRGDQVQHHIGQRAVVKLYGRTYPSRSFGILGPSGKEIDFTMMKADRYWIVRAKRGSGMNACRMKDAHDR